MPPSNVARPSSTPTAKKEAGRKKVGGKEAGPATRKASGDAVPIDEVSDKKNTPTLASPPSWDEMMEMLKHVPCFTDSESPSTKMYDFFPLTKRISVNMGCGPLSFVSARLPFGIPVSAVLRIQQLQDWTMSETIEVVILSSLPPFQVMHTSSLGTNLAFIIFFSW